MDEGGRPNHLQADGAKSSGEDSESGGMLSELDWDDVVEAFLGALLAGLLVLIIARALPHRRR